MNGTADTVAVIVAPAAWGQYFLTLAGRPLLSHIVREAMGVSRIEKVLVLASDSEVLAAARSAGAHSFEIPETAPACPPAHGLLLDLLESGRREETQAPLLLSPVTPLRRSQDVAAGIDHFAGAQVGGPVAVADAHPEVLAVATTVFSHRGGAGAVREPVRPLDRR